MTIMGRNPLVSSEKKKGGRSEEVSVVDGECRNETPAPFVAVEREIEEAGSGWENLAREEIGDAAILDLEKSYLLEGVGTHQELI